MTLNPFKIFYRCYFAWVILIACLALSGCSGSSDDESDDDQSAGVGGTGIVQGKATDFGSIYVNGQRFDTTQSLFIVDGNSNATQDDLAVGMVVRLEVDVLNGVFTSNASQVLYDDEVEGPVAATPVDVTGSGGTQKTFTVFGQTIVIDQTTTVFVGTTFGSLSASDMVEISGFRTTINDITATYVEKKGVLNPGVSEVELRGTIQSLAGTPPNQTFEVDAVTVNTNALTEIDIPGGLLANGLYVEVEGVIQADQSVLADEVEEENESLGNNLGNISLQGLISQYNSIADFQIDGQRIDASLASLEPVGAASLLEDGLEIEVEGEIVSGILIADELEIREGESELHSFVSAIDLANNRFEVSYAPLLGSVVINADGQTLFEDDGPLQLPNFSLDQMSIGDFVRIEGREISGEVTAATVKREDPDDSKLTGAVDAFDPGISITILGITYLVDAGTSYEGFVNANAFFSQLMTGDLIEIEDDQVADGIADEVEEED